ncbi:hypothetical protein [Verrucomicrobium spinosum]|uniref:hypothetical protein n=1 Tax=Verrucomicrobium spinosum TaxID=2736 RepID=UPI0009466B15|nr:hypothetical protein [Verrucomicrobium spinosum]
MQHGKHDHPVPRQAGRAGSGQSAKEISSPALLTTRTDEEGFTIGQPGQRHALTQDRHVPGHLHTAHRQRGAIAQIGQDVGIIAPPLHRQGRVPVPPCQDPQPSPRNRTSSGDSGGRNNTDLPDAT